MITFSFFLTLKAVSSYRNVLHDKITISKVPNGILLHLAMVFTLATVLIPKNCIGISNSTCMGASSENCIEINFRCCVSIIMILNWY